MSDRLHDDRNMSETIAALEQENAKLREEVVDQKHNYERACQTVAEMHLAAVGSIRGPIVGVVEDVAALREKLEEAKGLLKTNLMNFVRSTAEHDTTSPDCGLGCLDEIVGDAKLHLAAIRQFLEKQ